MSTLLRILLLMIFLIFALGLARAEVQGDRWEKAGDLVTYDLSTQAVCAEFERPPTGNPSWYQGLSTQVDDREVGGNIVAYQIQWFDGSWSRWYRPGVDDIDWKFNVTENTLRRVWSYFFDHTHRFIACSTGGAADLAVAIDDGVTAVMVGDAPSYQITVTNNGPNAVTGVMLLDVIPAELENAMSTPSVGVYDSPSGIWSGFLLGVGESATLTLDATVAATAVGSIAHTVTVSPLVGVMDPNPANNIATDVDAITGTQGTADLSITKDDGQTTVVPGSRLIYTITLSNGGPSTATNFRVVDTVPPELEDVVFTPSAGVYNPATGEWTGINLPPNTSTMITVEATVKDSAVGSVTNTVSVMPPVGLTDPDPANDTATDTDMIEAKADLWIMKDDGVTTVVPGQMLTYTITLKNHGPSTLTSATVIDTLPPELLGAVFTPSTGTYDSITGLWTGLTLGAGDSVTLTVDVTVGDTLGDVLTNTVTVTPPAGVVDPDPSSNTASDTDFRDTVIIFTDGFESGDLTRWSSFSP